MMTTSLLRSVSCSSLLAVALLAAAGNVSSVAGAPPEWTTSRQLIARSPSAFERLDTAGVEAIVKRLPRSLSQIPDFLRHVSDGVLLHRGDLTISGSFANGHALVVDGNVTIRGSYDDYRDGVGIFVVLGNLRAEHIVSWGSLAVTGALDATGLVYAYYNDYTFEVGGPVRARAVVIFDKSTNDPRILAPIVQTDDGDGADLAVRHFVPEVMVDDVLDRTDAESTTLEAVASYDVVRLRIAAGEPLFRDQPAPATLAADVLSLFAPRRDPAALLRLAAQDRLLALALASSQSTPVEVQRGLADAGDAGVLARLAANPRVDRAVARRIRAVR